MALPLTMLRRSPATLSPSLIRRFAASTATATPIFDASSAQKRYACTSRTLPLAPLSSPCGRSYSSTSVAANAAAAAAMAGGRPPVNRAFPQYSVFGEGSLLTLKPLMPTFKPAGGDGVAIDKRGKLMVGFTPHTGGSGSAGESGGKFAWKEQVMIALTAEEVGLIVNQLPSFPVEISRSASSGYGYGAATPDSPDKVLSLTPGDGATVLFKIDYVKDGIGGQLSPIDNQSASTPMEVLVQAGEFEVVKTLLQASIPHLLGWNPMMDIAVGHSLSNSGRGGGGGEGQGDVYG